MNEIKLVKPSIKYDKDIMRFRQEIIEADDHDSFAGCYSLELISSAEEWLPIIRQMEKFSPPRDIRDTPKKC